jgi:hypothetical protein
VKQAEAQQELESMHCKKMTKSGLVVAKSFAGNLKDRMGEPDKQVEKQLLLFYAVTRLTISALVDVGTNRNCMHMHFTTEPLEPYDT